MLDALCCVCSVPRMRAKSCRCPDVRLPWAGLRCQAVAELRHANAHWLLVCTVCTPLPTSTRGCILCTALQHLGLGVGGLACMHARRVWSNTVLLRHVLAYTTLGAGGREAARNAVTPMCSATRSARECGMPTSWWQAPYSGALQRVRECMCVFRCMHARVLKCARGDDNTQMRLALLLMYVHWKGCYYAIEQPAGGQKEETRRLTYIYLVHTCVPYFGKASVAEASSLMFAHPRLRKLLDLHGARQCFMHMGALGGSSLKPTVRRA